MLVPPTPVSPVADKVCITRSFRREVRKTEGVSAADGEAGEEEQKKGCPFRDSLNYLKYTNFRGLVCGFGCINKNSGGELFVEHEYALSFVTD